MKQGPEQSNNERTRREILQGALAAAVISATPHSFAQAQETTASLLAHGARFKEYFRGYPNIFGRLRKRDLGQLLRSMRVVRDVSVRGTAFDFSGLREGAVVLSSERGYGNGIVVKFNERHSDGTPGLYKRYMVITPKHVAKLAPAPFEKQWTHNPVGYDLSVCEISERDARSYGALFLARQEGNHDVTGEIGVVLGTDTDARKRFPAIISPRIGADNVFEREHLVGAMPFPRDFHDSRMIILPDGEARVIPTSSNGELPVQGMSGAPLMYVPRGAQGGHIAGVIISAKEIDIDGEKTSLGFCLDSQIIWQTIAALPERR